MKKLLKITLTLFFITIIVLGFTLPLNPFGNWYQQFLPSLGSQQINDIIFLDSLTGYAVTSRNVNPDTASILKTTNGGDNWQVVFSAAPKRLTRIQFINTSTGFVCGGSGGGTPQFYKTTNAGMNWSLLSSFGCALWRDMYVLNNDTIWLVDSDGLCGGVFRTTNGGVNWQIQYQGNNPNKIYMYDRNLGFISPPSLGALYRTTNSGVSWTQVTGESGFRDMQFADSQTGWKASGILKKTTDGGISWVQQTVPTGGIILSSNVNKISLLNKDTLWTVGAEAFYGSGQFRGIIYRTTNSGNNWLFQVPDTSIHLDTYTQIQFINSKTGWAYRHEGGIHTTNGGDTAWLTPITQVSNEIPFQFELYQNYPNPFNPKTIIKYSVMPNVKGQTSNVRLIVYDITGKEIITLVNQRQNAGTYEVDFSGKGYSSGVYFYRIEVRHAGSPAGDFVQTKKMVLVK